MLNPAPLRDELVEIGGAPHQLNIATRNQNLPFEKWGWWFNSTGANSPTKSERGRVAVDLSEPERAFAVEANNDNI
ncbi:MAG TPA: hypothetical protein DEB44_06285 [Acidimicrobiaceae bacterium]|nr:hypothetical protein [Acidimicrobiaceae bacterium]